MDCAYNTLTSNKFQFVLERIPETSFFVTEAELPDVSIDRPNMPFAGNSSNAFAGSSIDYSPLDVRFIVDENLDNWLEIFKWMKSMSRDTRKFVDTGKIHVSDGILTTLTNNSNTNIVFRFKDIFPVSLGSISFNTQTTAEPVYCSATFLYSEYDVQP